MESFHLLSTVCQFANTVPFYSCRVLFPEFHNAKIVSSTGTHPSFAVLRYPNSLVICFITNDSLMKEVKQSNLAHVRTSTTSLGKANKACYAHAMLSYDNVLFEIESFMDEWRFMQLCSTNSAPESPSGRGSPISAVGNSTSIVSMIKLKIESDNVFKLQRVKSSFFNTSDSKPCVIFTGHGLGGICSIIATLVGYMYGAELSVKCVTFGSPSYGDKKFTNNYKKYVHRNYNIVLRNDAMTKNVTKLAKKTMPNTIILRHDGAYDIKQLFCCALPCSSYNYGVEAYVKTLEKVNRACPANDALMVRVSSHDDTTSTSEDEPSCNK